MSLIGKWIDFVYTVATGSWKKKIIFAPIGALFYLGFIALCILLSFFTDNLLKFPQIISHPFDIIISVPIIIMGFFLMLLSVVFFLRVRGTPVPLSPPPKLVTTGPYKYVRNPMLTGIFAQLFGFGIFFHSISLFFIYTPLFIVINIWELKKIEEPELEKRLGKEYTEYKERVPMFFPWFQ